MNLYEKISYTKLFVYTYLVLFIFLLSYTFYRAEFIHNGNQLPYYFKYYLIFILGVFFWLLVLFLSEKNKLIIIILASVIIFLLYFYEIVRFYAPTILKSIPVESQLKEETKHDIIENLKKNEGINAVPSIFPKALLGKNLIDDKIDIFPLGGVSNKITVFCKEGKSFSIYKSDRYGFNNPDKEWDKEKIFWFLIGDSFVQGSCVQPGEDFASQIRFFTKESALSLGMSGNGPLIELASLIEYAVKKKPKIVLWFYFERNDLDDLSNEKTNPIFINYLNEGFSQELYSKQEEIDKKLIKYINLAKQKILGKINTSKKVSENFSSFKRIIRLKIIRDKMGLDRGLDFGVDPLLEKIIVKANNLVNTWDGKLFFVYLPDKERYSKGKIKNDSYLKRSQIINLIKKLNIPLIDIHEDFFVMQNDPISFYAERIYGHYSPEGYSKISKTIIKKVRELNSF
tara:strand:- start:2658 stop:4025 length:1368 start_codon:yes stop_codon:yes gene_type:complete